MPTGLGLPSTTMTSFLQTDTSKQQHELEVKVADLYQDLQEFDDADREEMLMLFRDKHTRYLQVQSHGAAICEAGAANVAFIHQEALQRLKSLSNG